jgi:two-component system, NarL family, response regulator DevR
MAIRVFLLDDHEVVRRGVADLLSAEDDIEIVGEASTAEEAVGRILALSPDVCVLDVRLPDGSGVEVCRAVREKRPAVACLMLTSFSDDEALLEAVLAGASGYLLKQVRGSDLVDAVRRVSQGQSLLDQTVTDSVLRRLREGSPDDERLRGLTEQERKVLALLAQGRTNRQIADELFLAEKTIKNYVSNVLAKLGMSRRTEAAVWAARIDERKQH